MAGLPFELAGAPGLDPSALADALNRRRLPGIVVEPATWHPFSHVYAGQECSGVRLRLGDVDRVPLTRLNFELLEAVRKVDSSRPWFSASAVRNRMFDFVCGTDRVRRMLQAGKPAAQIWVDWNSGGATFRVQRQPYLMYD
jgi:uncharacterized protein YbbC (DUF1343 family)